MLIAQTMSTKPKGKPRPVKPASHYTGKPAARHGKNGQPGRSLEQGSLKARLEILIKKTKCSPWTNAFASNLTNKVIESTPPPRHFSQPGK